VNRDEKKELLSALQDVFKESSLVVVVHNLGLTVADMTKFRNNVRKAGAKFKIAKNRIARLALSGTENEGLSKLLTGPTGIAYSKDPVAAAKVVAEFAKSNEKMVVLGAIMDGKILNVEAVKALATLPSMDELRGKLVGLLQAPAIKIARIASAPAAQIARVLDAHAKKAA